MPEMTFQCTNCRRQFEADPTAEQLTCANCGRALARTAQVGQILDVWYHPRRWYRDVPKPSLNFLVEMLWTAEGQGEKLYAAVSPPNVNYQSFVHQVTRAVMRGIDEGWARLEVPADPFEDNPIYKLSYLDSERFADSVTVLFPNVDWDETITVEEPVAAAEEGK